MAFLLLASAARDDMALLVQQIQKKKPHDHQLHRWVEQSDSDDHSHHSLPKNWKSHTNHRSAPNSWKKFHFHLPSRHHNYTSNDSGTWRQKRRVKRAAKEIQAAVEERLAQSPFLSSDSSNSDSQDVPNGPPKRELPIVRREELNIRFWLGRGGFCDVWEVGPFDKYSDHNKAVFKHLRSALLPHHPSLFSHSSKEASAFVLGAIDLRMEALYLSQLSHPNIIELLGVVQPKHGLPYGDAHHDGYGLLLEPLHDTLDQRLEDWERQVSYDLDSSEAQSRHGESDKFLERHYSPKRLETVLNYASQIADALQYLHERRIVLCDVKPSNVGLTIDDTIKLFDFGLCRELPALQPDQDDDPHRLYTLPVAGTPNYLPPEVLVQKKYNCLADVYSWAILLHYMISLRRPFDNLDRKDHFCRVAQGGERPSLNDGGEIPSAIHTLLEHTWDGDVKQRWTIAEAKEELDRIRTNLGFSLASPPMKHHRRMSSNMDLLLYAGSEVDTSSEHPKSERWTGSSVASMTADDFEKYFASYDHHRQ